MSDRPPEKAAATVRLTHLDEHGHARMVDVTAKPVTLRVAEARCRVRASSEALVKIAASMDDVLADARGAGVHAAKLTSHLIPLCHPLPLDDVEVRATADDDGVDVLALTVVESRTGVEMEALTACAVAALSVAAALSAHDPAVSITDLTLWHKSGGRSGTWERDPGSGTVRHSAGPDPS